METRLRAVRLSWNAASIASVSAPRLAGGATVTSGGTSFCNPGIMASARSESSSSIWIEVRRLWRPRSSCAQPMSMAAIRSSGSTVFSSVRMKNRGWSSTDRPAASTRNGAVRWLETATATGSRSQASMSSESPSCAPSLKTRSRSPVNGSTPRRRRYSPGWSGNVTIPSTNGVAERTPGNPAMEG